MENKFIDNAGVIAPPPLIFAVLLIAGLLLHWALPVRIMPHSWAARLIIGILLLIIPGIMGVLSFQIMRQSKTAINPRKQTTTIITKGPFSFTRNPLYVSLLLFYGGIAILVNALWSILLLPVMLIIFDRGVVIREEEYLEQKFGNEYLQYKKRVRRWF